MRARACADTISCRAVQARALTITPFAKEVPIEPYLAACLHAVKIQVDGGGSGQFLRQREVLAVPERARQQGA